MKGEWEPVEQNTSKKNEKIKHTHKGEHKKHIDDIQHTNKTNKQTIQTTTTGKQESN